MISIIKYSQKFLKIKYKINKNNISQNLILYNYLKKNKYILT